LCYDLTAEEFMGREIRPETRRVPERGDLEVPYVLSPAIMPVVVNIKFTEYVDCLGPTHSSKGAGENIASKGIGNKSKHMLAKLSVAA
jgi:hypothetical protein